MFRQVQIGDFENHSDKVILFALRLLKLLKNPNISQMLVAPTGRILLSPLTSDKIVKVQL